MFCRIPQLFVLISFGVLTFGCASEEAPVGGEPVLEAEDETPESVVPPRSLRLGAHADRVHVGDELAFGVDVEYADGSFERVRNYVVSAVGPEFENLSAMRVKAVQAGEGELEILAAGLKTRTVVTVADPAPVAMAILPDSFEMEEGSEFQFTLEFVNDEGEVVEGPTAEWSVTNGDILDVNDSGRVTALSPGPATLLVTAGEFSAEASVRVESYVPRSINIRTSADYAVVGETIELQAIGDLGRAFEGDVEWRISDSTYGHATLTVDPTDSQKATLEAVRSDSVEVEADFAGKIARRRIPIMPAGWENTVAYSDFCSLKYEGNLIQFHEFDALGRKILATKRSVIIRYTYEGMSDRLLLEEYDDDRDGTYDRQAAYEYDDMGRILKRTTTSLPTGNLRTTEAYAYANPPATDYVIRTYDALGDEQNHLHFWLDSGGRVVRITRSNGYEIAYAKYDAEGRLLELYDRRQSSNYYYTWGRRYTWQTAQVAEVLEGFWTSRTTILPAASYRSTFYHDVGGNPIAELWEDGIRTLWSYDCVPGPAPR